MRQSIIRTLLGVLVMFLAFGPAQLTLSQAAKSKKTVNVELIVDESGSMAAATDTGVLRIDAAKQVMAQVISAIPDVEGVNVGLRVYGHKGDNTDAGRAESCVSSELLVPMNGVDTTQLTAQVNALQPVGWTPLGFALEEAAKDFKEPASDDVVNAIVMVTDGLETCDADPIAIAAKLHDSKAGIITHVVGFGTTPEEQTTLSEIAKSGGGQLLGSNNAGQLMDALFSILEKLEVVDETGTGETRDSPLGVGRIGKVGDYEISVLSVTPDATDEILAINPYNVLNKEGNQFFLARISLTYKGKATGKPGSDINFQSVGKLSTSYTMYNDQCGVYDESLFSVDELFEGGSVEANVCWQIDGKDEDSLVMYVEPNAGITTEPVWFSLGNRIEKVVDPDSTAVATKTPRVALKKTPFPTVSAGASDGKNSRTSPLEVGRGGTVGDYEVSVIAFTPNATDEILAINPYNELSQEGNKFFLARVSVKFNGVSSGNPSSDLAFQAVGQLSKSYTTYNDSCGVYNEPLYSVDELFQGGVAEANVCWQIDGDDEASLVMYVEPNTGLKTEPVWFSLGNPVAVKSDSVATEEPLDVAKSTETSIPETFITLVATDIKFSKTEIRVSANTEFTIKLTNEGVLQHGFAIDSLGIIAGPLNHGDYSTISSALPPGVYDFYCPVPGHKEAGMVGTLIVE